jgi:hypothetical protein
MKSPTKLFILLLFGILCSSLTAEGGAFIELSSGYILPFGAWRSTYGKGLSLGGMAGFSISEFVNPGIGGFLFFPKTGGNIKDEYTQLYGTEYISLFTSTTMIYIVDRIDIALNEADKLSFDIGYGIHSQRNYVTIINTNFGTSEFLSGHGPFLGLSVQKMLPFSAFDYIMPFVKIYYSPSRVSYNIIDTDASIIKHHVSKERYGFIIGISLISIGEE